MNRGCGSMEYEMSNGRTIIGSMSRRDIAETIRMIPQERARTMTRLPVSACP